MIFETLMESMDEGELILIEYGYCRYHWRKDGTIVIYEILVSPHSRGKGIGTRMLRLLYEMYPESIFAKCPVDLEANKFYASRGFKLEGQETTKSGRVLNLWRLKLS